MLSPIEREALRVSLQVAATSTALSLSLAVAAAWVLSRFGRLLGVVASLVVVIGYCCSIILRCAARCLAKRWA